MWPLTSDFGGNFGVHRVSTQEIFKTEKKNRQDILSDGKVVSRQHLV